MTYLHILWDVNSCQQRYCNLWFTKWVDNNWLIGFLHQLLADLDITCYQLLMVHNTIFVGHWFLELHIHKNYTDWYIHFYCSALEVTDMWQYVQNGLSLALTICAHVRVYTHICIPSMSLMGHCIYIRHNTAQSVTWYPVIVVWCDGSSYNE